MSVEYITMPGWKSSIAGCKVYEDLPANAKKYIETIEQYLNIPGIYEFVVAKDRLLNENTNQSYQNYQFMTLLFLAKPG